jgi:hypothetical protein
LRKLHEELPESPPVINVLMSSPNQKAIIMESLMSAMPLMTISSDNIELQDHDVLLCDPESLKDRMFLGKPMPGQVFLFLYKPAEIIPFQDISTLEA